MTKRTSRRNVIKTVGTAGVVGLTSLAGCIGGGDDNSDGGSTGGSSNPILFGATVSLTGKFSTNGKLTEQGYKLWQTQANENGGISVGGTQRKVELKLYDDQSSSSKARQQYQKLVSKDNADLLLGPYSSGMTKAVGPIAEKNEIPMIAGGAASKDVYTQGWDYMHGTLPLAPTYMENVVKMADEMENPPTNVGIMHVNTLFPTGVGEGAEAAVKDASNLSFKFRESYPSGTKDLSSIIQQAKNQHVDLLIGGTHTQSAILAVKQMKSNKYNPDMLGFSVGPPTPDFRDSLGESANYALGVTMWLPAMDQEGPYIGTASNYADLFKDQFDTEPDYHAASTTADGVVFQRAIEEHAQSADPKEVEAALEKVDFETFYGPVNFSEGKLGTRGANLGKSAGVLQIQDGEPVLVYPGGEEFQYPMPTWSER